MRKTECAIQFAPDVATNFSTVWIDLPEVKDIFQAAGRMPRERPTPFFANWLSKLLRENVPLERIDKSFQEWATEFGSKKANILYWKNIFFASWPLLKTKSIEALKLLGLYELIRRFLE